jgi:hypothetical protein
VRHRSDTLAAWRSAHHLTPRWLGGVVGAWLCHGVFAAVAIPLDYPYEARGQVIDTGVVVGLVLPIAVVAVALDEGPDYLVRGAARSLLLVRFGLAVAYLEVVAGMAAVVAVVAALPLLLVVLDAVLLASLTLTGTSVFGVKGGWIPAAAAAVIVSAPGLLPWKLNLMYHLEVGRPFVVAVLGLGVAATAIYLLRGSVRMRSPG